MKTNDLIGPALDWAVAKCMDLDVSIGDDKVLVLKEHCQFCNATAHDHWYPSTDWAQGGPIIERENINLSAYELDDDGNTNPGWQAWPNYGMSDWYLSGPTPLIAAMRCYVASKLGEEVDVPEELL
jgi:hypothetical protein